MPTSHKIKTLIFPALNISFFAVIVFLILLFDLIETEDIFSALAVSFLLGAMLSGAVPLLLIHLFDLDTSEYFKGLLAFSILSVPLCLATVSIGLMFYITPLVLFVLHLAYRIFKYIRAEKTSSDSIITSAVVFVSNPLLLYIGLAIDLIRVLSWQ